MFRESQKIIGNIFLPVRQSDTYPSDKGLVEAALITIRSGLFACVAENPDFVEEGSLDEVSWCVRNRSFNATTYYFLDDGFVLNRTTKSNLENRSHRLKVPYGNENIPEYHREPYDIDDQSIGSEKITLSGIEAISRDLSAVKELLVFERDVVYHSANWEGMERSISPITRC